MQRQILIYIASLTLAACSGTGQTNGDDELHAGPADGSPGGVAVQVVAEQTRLPASEFSVVSEEAVQFSDGSLGCPQDDTAYMQMVLPGHKVVVERKGTTYDVRVAGGRGLICETGE